ncbi:MAG: hypothetical protein LRY54_01925 [Alphaproteobacteria bacterium]|nr:hypothetical protein [Alphaproteobacteria bacterium]
MYPRPRVQNYDKFDKAKRWALNERVFFACGGCHILAYAFLERYESSGYKACWIKPDAGFRGNHIFVTDGSTVFDYHGYAEREFYLAHIFKRAQNYYPGWGATLVDLPPDVLISEEKSKTFDGLWLMEPGQFLHDALPRARQFLDRFPAPG